MSCYLQFAAVLPIAFSNKVPNIVPHHMFVILSLVMAFKVQLVLMKALALLLWVSSHVFLDFVKMGKNIYFQGHSGSHFGIVLYERLNQFHIVYSLVIRMKKATHHFNETVPSPFLHPI